MKCLYRFSLAVDSLVSVVINFSDRAYRAALEFFAVAFALLRPEPFDLSGAGWSDAVPAGAPLDSALQNSLRHEARVPKRSAPRHT